MKIFANNINIEYEDYGKLDDPVLILIRGLGSQLIHWPKDFINGFVAQGYRVIIFDNRDIGLSSPCPVEGISYDKKTIIDKINAGEEIVPAYTLDDMALDVIGLMDGLHIAKAHVFGMSLGGVVAQVLAINYQHRLISTTIVMSAAKLTDPGRIKQVALEHVTKDDYVSNALYENKIWGNSKFPVSEDYVRDLATKAYERGVDSEAVNRQFSAIYSFGDRREALKLVDLPCLVIHGEDDVLVLPDEGEEISSLVKNSEFEIISGMGHEITPSLSPIIINLVHTFLQRRC